MLTFSTLNNFGGIIGKFLSLRLINYFSISGGSKHKKYSPDIKVVAPQLPLPGGGGVFDKTTTFLTSPLMEIKRLSIIIFGNKYIFFLFRGKLFLETMFAVRLRYNM